MSSQVEKLLFKPSEAAEATGFGRSTVYAKIATGELPSIRVGRSVRIPVEALRGWIARALAEQGGSQNDPEMTLDRGEVDIQQRAQSQNRFKLQKRGELRR